MKRFSCNMDAPSSPERKALTPAVLLAFVLMMICAPSAAQFPGRKIPDRLANDISPGKVWVKYICNFPVERTDIMRTDNGRQLQVPVYDNAPFMEPVMTRVMEGSVSVFDPNFWDDVTDLGKEPLPGEIDTSKILRYLDAGADTNILVDESGNISLMPVYREPDLGEVSGIFFMETWLVNIRRALFHKEVLAWLPIRDYFAVTDQGPDPVEQRRLLFMASPFIAEKRGGKKTREDYRLVYRDRVCEINLYNRPYTDYLYREESGNGITKQEYEEWVYHEFDFYKFFNRKIFLDKLLSAVAGGQLPAFDAESGQPLGPLERNRLMTISTEEINSIIFHEDWYLDPSGLSVFKAVKSLVLVRHIRDFDEYTGEYIRTRKVPLLEVRLKPG